MAPKTEAQKAQLRDYWARNKDVLNARRVAKYAANPGARVRRREADRVYNRKRLGVVDATGVQYTALCEICGRLDTLVLDHDHTTGIIRGWLCGRCNRGLGLFKDCPEALRAAAAYVELHQEKK